MKFLYSILFLIFIVGCSPLSNKPITVENLEKYFSPYGKVTDLVKADLRGIGQQDTIAFIKVQRHDLIYKIFDTPSWNLSSKFWKVMVWSTQDGKNTLIWQNGKNGLIGENWGVSLGVLDLDPAGGKPFIVFNPDYRLTLYQWDGETFEKVFNVPIDSRKVRAEKIDDKRTVFLVDDDGLVCSETLSPFPEIYVYENKELVLKSKEYPDFYQKVFREFESHPDIKSVKYLYACLYSGLFREGLRLSEKMVMSIDKKIRPRLMKNKLFIDFREMFT